MKNFDLFGGETEILEQDSNPNNMSKYQKTKLFYHYRKSTDEKRCSNCSNHIGGGYHGKQYHKCKLIGVSHSFATDIRVSAVCDAHSYPENYLELLRGKD